MTCYASCASVPVATGKPVGMRQHLLTTHFSTTTLADSGHNQGKSSLTFWAVTSVGTHPGMPKLQWVWQMFSDGSSHMHLLMASTIDIVHKGTNQKAQQSCRGGTS